MLPDCIQEFRGLNKCRQTSVFLPEGTASIVDRHPSELMGYEADVRFERGRLIEYPARSWQRPGSASKMEKGRAPRRLPPGNIRRSADWRRPAFPQECCG
jgi:hypothetical protein